MKTPTCKADSIAILGEYKNKLTTEQYRNIERVIGHQAIEEMFLNRSEIDRAVRTETGMITYKEAMAEILSKRAS